MKSVIRRLNRLEDRFGPKKPRNVLRMVVTEVGDGEPDLEPPARGRFAQTVR
jgi:hypothetical protein